MNKTNKIIVIVVLALVVLFGVGQFFANPSTINPAATNQTTSTATQTAPVAPATQVIAYTPVPPPSSTPVEKGSCWTNSIAAPFRPDAWRCAVGNGISDPCFQIPNSTDTLLCAVNPTVLDSTSTFVLKLTQPLSGPQVPPGTPPSDWAWLVQLADGTLCTPFTGTLPITATGEAANYGCAPGPLGNNLMIFGELNSSSSAWTAEVGTISESTTSSLPVITNSSTVGVETVWQ